VRHWIDGKPFYCATCGLGYGEYMACEEADCALESDAAAKARAALPSADKVPQGKRAPRRRHKN